MLKWKNFMICIWHCFECEMDLSQHKSRQSYGWRDECWDKSISHEKQYHMHFLAQERWDNTIFTRNFTEYRPAPWRITHVEPRCTESSTTHESVFIRNFFRYLKTKVIYINVFVISFTFWFQVHVFFAFFCIFCMLRNYIDMLLGNYFFRVRDGFIPALVS